VTCATGEKAKGGKKEKKLRPKGGRNRKGKDVSAPA